MLPLFYMCTCIEDGSGGEGWRGNGWRGGWRGGGREEEMVAVLQAVQGKEEGQKATQAWLDPGSAGESDPLSFCFDQLHSLLPSPSLTLPLLFLNPSLRFAACSTSGA